MGAGSSIRRLSNTKTNAEFISSLRTNFSEHAAIPHTNGNGSTTHTPMKSHHKTWTRSVPDASTLEIPALNFASSVLEEEREQYDITLKLFYLPSAPSSPSERAVQTREAVNLVLKELHMPSIDLLIVSFPGVYFDEQEDCPDKISTRGPVEADPEALESQIESWKALEALHDEGLVSRLGIAEFGGERLGAFLGATRVRPSVNQINLRDCCSVPKDLMALAKKEGVELLVHNDCSNILPRGTVRELLGPGPDGAGVLAGTARTGDKRKSMHGEEQSNGDAGLTGEVEPQWVVKYTAVVKNRGVVENKGYFACAELKG